MLHSLQKEQSQLSSDRSVATSWGQKKRRKTYPYSLGWGMGSRADPSIMALHKYWRLWKTISWKLEMNLSLRLCCKKHSPKDVITHFFLVHGYGSYISSLTNSLLQRLDICLRKHTISTSISMCSELWTCHSFHWKAFPSVPHGYQPGVFSKHLISENLNQHTEPEPRPPFQWTHDAFSLPYFHSELHAAEHHLPGSHLACGM